MTVVAVDAETILVNDAASAHDLPVVPRREGMSVVEFYVAACRAVGCRPNEAIVGQLPAFATSEPFYRLTTIDARRTYLGDAGVVAVAAVLSECPRVTHVLLPRVGMRVPSALLLFHVLQTHAGVRCVDVSFNDLGTTVGRKILNVVQRHRRIHRVGLTDTLIVPPWKRRIEAEIARNASMVDMFHPPLIPHEDDTPERIAERARFREAEIAALLERQRIARAAERFPAWVCGGLAALTAAVVRHANSLTPIRSLLQPPECRGWVPLADVARGFLRLDVREIVGGNVGAKIPPEEREARVADFASLLGIFDATSKCVDVEALLLGLRVGCMTNDGAFKSSSLPRAPRAALTTLFDARKDIAEGCRALDVDDVGYVTKLELLVGVASVCRNATMEDVRRVMAELLPPLPHGVEEEDESTLQISYRSVLDRLVVDTDHLESVRLRERAEWWAATPRSECMRVIHGDITTD